MPVFVHLQGAFHGSRDEGTACLQRALDVAGASLTDVRFFSGIMTVFSFEAASEELPKLFMELEREGVSFARPPLEEVAGNTGVVGTISVTFTEGDPDLRNDVPAIPG